MNSNILRTIRANNRRHVRLREAVAATAEPALQRGGTAPAGSGDGGNGVDPGEHGSSRTCPTCHGSGMAGTNICATCSGSGLKGDGSIALQESVALRPSSGGVQRLREATATGAGPVYEVELLREGLGNQRDAAYYTAAALREAVASGVFNGMQAYADHPGKDEEANRPERTVRSLVGYYRNVRFKESGSSGKPTVAAELVVNQGQQWFVHLLESAIAAKGDGVQLCGISIDAGGLVEPGQLAGTPVQFVREITEAPSADIVTRPAAGGTILRRLRESEARTQLPEPQEVHRTMKATEVPAKIGAIHTQLREAVAKLTDKDATDDTIKESITTLRESEAGLEALAGIAIEPEEKVVEKLVPASEDAETAVKLREAEQRITTLESENGALTSKVTAGERATLAIKALREAEIPADSIEGARHFNALVKLDSEDAMKEHLNGVKAYEESLLTRFRESMGISSTSGVEGAGALAPTAPSGGADNLAELGIPTLAADAA